MKVNILAIPAGLFAAFGLIMSFWKTKKIIYPGVVFNFIWLVAIIMNQNNPNHFYAIHENTYAVILLGITSFNIPFLLCRTNRRSRITEANESLNEKSAKKILFVQLIIFMALIPLLLKAIQFHAIYGTAAFRSIYAEGVKYGYMTVFERLLYIHYVIFPISMVTNGMQIILWTKGITNVKYLIFGLVNEVIIMYCSAARGNLLIVILFFIFAVFISSMALDKVEKYFKRVRRQLKWFIIAGVALLVFMSIQRGNVDEGNFILGFYKTLATNFSGGFNLLDQAVNSPEDWGLNEYRFGTASLRGFVEVLLFAIRLITLNRVNIELTSVAEYASHFFNVSDTTKMNAYVTVFYTFMQDFGILGVVLLSMFFGYISVRFYNKVMQTATIKNTMFLMFMLVTLFYTTVRWQLMIADWGAMFVHVIWLSMLIGENSKKKLKVRI